MLLRSIERLLSSKYMSNKTYEYDIAISYADEDRSYAEAVSR
jgi:hypothetical protein